MSNSDKNFVPPLFLNSERYFQNKTTVDAGITDIQSLTPEDWFLMHENVIFLAKMFYRHHKNHQYGDIDEPEELDYSFFRETIPKWMKEFIEKHMKVENAKMNVVPGYSYHFDAVNMLNKEFFEEYHSLIQKNNDQPDWNPFKATQKIGRINEFENTMETMKLDELSERADAYQALDVWAPVEVSRWNKHYRYGNKIPPWKYGMHAKHFDRSNDGLRALVSERASLDTPIRGYDMSDVWNNTSSYSYNKWGGSSS